MNHIDKLIKALQEAKAGLEKNVNCAPGAEPINMAKEEKPQFGSVTVKDTTPKPTNVAKPFGSVIMKEEMEKDAADPKLAPKDVKVKALQGQIDNKTYKPDSKKIAEAMLKEELTCSENGQWSMEKARGTSSVYNAGTHPMKAREARVGNFPHYDYDTSAPHEDNIKQAKAHFEKHPSVKFSDSQLHAHVKQQQAKAQAEEK